jgi:hypothetical protein
MRVAREIASYMNNFGLAFKTYRISQLDDMMKQVAGDGARVSSETSAEAFENSLMQRGFLLFPPICEATDGHVRIYRSQSLLGNLLNAIRYPGDDGDEQLARVLKTIRNRRRPDDLQVDAPED